jgi:hypothetical protein
MATITSDVDNPAYVSAEHTGVTFLCPSCEHPLEYVGSHPASGQTDACDPNDYFRCPAGCGIFEHERRSHRLRQLE